MRLLTTNDSGEFILNEFASDNIPPYAILSHVWDKGGEVTYSDLVEGINEDTPGYNKLKFCVSQADLDGFKHSWIDTCCIDKHDRQAWKPIRSPIPQGNLPPKPEGQPQHNHSQ